MHKYLTFIFPAIVMMTGCSIAGPPLVGNEVVVNYEAANSNTLYPKERVDEKRANLNQKTSGNWKIERHRLGKDNLISVFFFDENSGWVASLKGDKLVPEGGNLYRTTNGGKAWSKSKLKLPRNSLISEIFFLNESRGWLVIQTGVNYRENISSEIQIIETNDGGQTWKPQLGLKNAYASKLLFDQTGQGWLIGFKGEATFVLNQAPLALHTSDFGKSWEDVSPSVVSENNTQSNLRSPDSLRDIQPTSLKQATAITRSGKILGTLDGGLNWSLDKTLSDREFTEGFRKLFVKEDSGHLAVSGAHVPEGIWTLFTVEYENAAHDKYFLPGTFVQDAILLSNDETIACGLGIAANEKRERVGEVGLVIHSKGYETWEVIYETPEGCEVGCAINKITRGGIEKFYSIGDNGLFLSISRRN